MDREQNCQTDVNKLNSRGGLSMVCFHSMVEPWKSAEKSSFVSLSMEQQPLPIFHPIDAIKSWHQRRKKTFNSSREKRIRVQSPSNSFDSRTQEINDELDDKREEAGGSGRGKCSAKIFYRVVSILPAIF